MDRTGDEGSVAQGLKGRGWRRIGGAAVALLAVIGVGGVATLGSPTSAGVVAAVAAEPLAVLAGRSPGWRPLGSLFQSKPYVVVIELPPPAPGRAAREAAREKVASAPGPRPSYVVSQDIPEAAPVAPVVADAVASAMPASGGTAFLGGGGGYVVPPVGGAGGLVVPGVPEPGTWAMMIVGFGAVGMAIRRRRTAGIPA